MKQKDLLLIGVVAFISILLSIGLTSVIFKPASRQQKAEVVEAISDDFPEADKKYFNDTAIDPTRLIKIGDGSNPTPFVDSGQ